MSTIQKRLRDAALFGILPILLLFISFSSGSTFVVAMLIFGILFTLILLPRGRLCGHDLAFPTMPAVALVAFSVLAGGEIYAQLQKHYQERLYHSVASVDVLEDLCARTPGLLQADCRGPVISLDTDDARARLIGPTLRGALSYQAIWSLLREADLLDIRNFPNPTSLKEAKNVSVPTEVVVSFLRAPARREETSFGLLRELMRPCGRDGEGDDMGKTTEEEEKARKEAANATMAMNLMLALTLADLESRNLTTDHAGFDELDLDDTMDSLASLHLYEFARSDIAALRITSDEFRDFRDLQRKQMPKPYRDAGILSALLVSGYAFQQNDADTYFDLRKIRNSKTSSKPAKVIGSYVTLPEGSTDAKVAVCPALFNRTDETSDEDTGEILVNSNNAVEPFNLNTDAEFFEVLRMREALALHIAGRIRTADGARSARFWVTLVTGYEQASMIVLFILGALVALVRIGCLACASMKNGAWFAHAGVSPNRLLFGLRSSRWPLRLIASILPAIGFVGTVRGIMLSLTGADQIVWASSVNERSSAISALSTDLGLAFATTLIALILGIVLSVIINLEQRLCDVVVAGTLPDVENQE